MINQLTRKLYLERMYQGDRKFLKIIIAILSTVIIGLFIWIVVIKEEPPVIENWPEIEYCLWE